ncbi:probable ADP-ribosylation factor GTPase-activating protein AGD14 [Euphorbia lathyris]|uniref:probable ADP-ribosylation factor GTPase-activating protein AGD14 n=1 Tax=Euphorbia lathyris TaxID=212925 RepID=UPI0033132CF4
MGSRKEEERNEKIIRGLMKLPPNRRCINCNSLGPQYVCTNFWTFVCMTCSGIHREFTHRVKSVSMSKFTSQEVEALQNGGNQRAREIYLRDWDQQRQRLPDNSNADKVREFIKTIYVDKKYAGGKSHEKPPRDLQRLRSNEEETRRASSYHSYSQSPPYDFQYEDRRYGKQAVVLTRKPGSDRGHNAGKISSFICSPTRLSERTLEDRFANEGSVSRFSDFSASSGGDLVSAGSPNFQKEIGFSSTPVQAPRDAFGEDAHQRVDLFSERSTSLGSMGSFDSNSISLRSYNSGGLVDAVSEPEQAVASHQDVMPTIQKASGSYDSLNQFKAPVVPESDASAASPIDLFQFPETLPAPPANFFEASPLDPVSSANAYQTTQTTMPVSLDLFVGNSQQQLINSLDQNIPAPSAPKNEGWATFDTQPIASTQGNGNLKASVTQFVGSSVKFDQVSSSNTSMQWPPFQNSSVQGSSSVSDPWKNNGLHDFQIPENTSAPMWNAFGSPITHSPSEETDQNTEPQDPNLDHIQRSAPYGGLPGLNGLSEVMLEPAYTPAVNPMMEGNQSYATNHKSTNPFDFPYDSDLEPSDMFLDMSSFQGALPNLAGVTEPWFPQDTGTNYIPSAQQGGLAYMAGQASSPQLANLQAQGPVASIGGNPFA